jgi:hypothetical protein
MLTFKEYLKEDKKLQKMTPAEWLKYDWRIELFLKKFRNKDPFELANGKKVIFDYDKVVERNIASRDRSEIAKVRLFGASDGNIYKMSDLGKSVEFGGQGSKSSSAMTSLAESAQCLYCAAAWYGKDYSPETLKGLTKNVNITESIEKIIDELPDSWINSSIAIAKRLKEEFGNKRYSFHRGSEWFNTLEKKFKFLNKREREFSNLNKWSPADIYMLTSIGEAETFSEANSIIELNAILLKHIRNGDIIPVSLKKVDPDNVNLKYVNLTDNKSTYEISKPHFTAGKKDFFNSKDVYMYFKEGQIQFRGFNPIDFQGEIKGKYASHGKVSFGTINRYLKILTNGVLESPSSIADRYRKSPKNLYIDFFTYYIKITEGPKIDYNDFVKKASTKDLGWHISKYIGCQMLYRISRSSKDTLDAFIGSLIGYAASESEMSAPFVKVS